MAAPRLWVYKCNSKPANNGRAAYGDWEDLFDLPSSQQPVEWGGSWATNREYQKRVFKEEVEIGDLILAYQTDRQAGIGLTKVVNITVDGDENCLWLTAIDRFRKPAKYHQMKRTTHPHLKEVAAFKSGPVETIAGTSRQEAYWLLEASGSRQAQLFKP